MKEFSLRDLDGHKSTLDDNSWASNAREWGEFTFRNSPMIEDCVAEEWRMDDE